MRTTAETLAIEQLLRDLVESYTLEPDRLRLEVEEHPARVNIRLRVSAADMPLLIGTRGAHSRPLVLLVREIGKNAGKFYKFDIEDPEPGECSSFPTREPATAYDPAPAVKLLERLLLAIGVGEFRVEAREMGRERGWLRHQLVVYTRDDDDYRLLTVRPSTTDTQTIVEALGTLFRAAAKKAGVMGGVQVERNT